MRKATVATLGLLLVAGSALASNTGFKLNYTLRKVALKSGNNYVSLPYFYFPTGVVGTAGNSIDACQDANEGDRLNTPKVSSIIWIDPATDSPRTQQCASLAPVPTFALTPGFSYSYKAKNDNTVINIVGSHDDDYAKAPKCTTGCKFITLRKVALKSGNNWISVPYHVKSNNSIDLCSDVNDGDRLNTPKVSSIIYIDPATDSPRTQQCASLAPVPSFDIVPGTGYSMKAKVDGVTINTEVY